MSSGYPPLLSMEWEPLNMKWTICLVFYWLLMNWAMTIENILLNWPVIGQILSPKILTTCSNLRIQREDVRNKLTQTWSEHYWELVTRSIIRCRSLNNACGQASWHWHCAHHLDMSRLLRQKCWQTLSAYSIK